VKRRFRAGTARTFAGRGGPLHSNEEDDDDDTDMDDDCDNDGARTTFLLLLPEADDGRARTAQRSEIIGARTSRAEKRAGARAPPIGGAVDANGRFVDRELLAFDVVVVVVSSYRPSPNPDPIPSPAHRQEAIDRSIEQASTPRGRPIGDEMPRTLPPCRPVPLAYEGHANSNANSLPWKILLGHDIQVGRSGSTTIG
jgi:hypothetical protein